TALRRLMFLGRWFPPLVKAVKGNITATADLYPLGLARCLLHLRPTTRFFADADAGTLPAFCIVDPDFGAFSEENPQDIRYGESFAAEVITRVMRGKGWPHTLLIWLYDEHGGYYDHVPPPAAPPPDDVLGRSLLTMPGWLHAALKPFFGSYFASVANLDAGPHRYDRYGFRVPAVIVSPYARPGYVTSTVFDHSSVLKLLQLKWNLPPLTDRDAAAQAPLDALDLAGEPAFLTPPDLPAPSLAWGTWPGGYTGPRAARRRRRRGWADQPAGQVRGLPGPGGYRDWAALPFAAPAGVVPPGGVHGHRRVEQGDERQAKSAQRGKPVQPEYRNIGHGHDGPPGQAGRGTPPGGRASRGGQGGQPGQSGDRGQQVEPRQPGHDPGEEGGRVTELGVGAARHHCPQAGQPRIRTAAVHLRG